MLYRHSIAVSLVCVFVICAFGAWGAQAQKKQKPPPPATGGIRGRVRVAEGSAGNVSVTVRRGEREVATTTTNAKGEFVFDNLDPGSYALTLRKPGLQVGRMEDLVVKAGRVVNLSERLYLPVDDGAIAFLKGSVFNTEGRSIYGARVEVVQLRPDGSSKKVSTAYTTRQGMFAFRLPPLAARYRVTAKADGMETATKEIEIDGAAIFRIALELAPAAK